MNLNVSRLLASETLFDGSLLLLFWPNGPDSTADSAKLGLWAPNRPANLMILS